MDKTPTPRTDAKDANLRGTFYAHAFGPTYDHMRGHACDLEIECAEFRLDAMRYRALRETQMQLGPDAWMRTGDDLDEAIDALIAKG